MRLTGRTECRRVAPLFLKVAAIFLITLGCLAPVYAHFGSCEDHTAECPRLQRAGLCQSHKQFMLQNCPVSCDTCVDPNCHDRNEKCSINARRGLCNTQKNFMLALCPHSCEACKIGPATAARLSDERTIINPNFECGKPLRTQIRKRRIAKRQVIFPDELKLLDNQARIIPNQRNPTVLPQTQSANRTPIQLTPSPEASPTSSPHNIDVEDTFCGASPITDRFLITAAHCVFDPDRRVGLVRLGELDFAQEGENNSKPVDYVVEQIIVHPDFDPSSLERYNDIALIKTVERIQFNELVYPYCISDKAPAPGSKVIGAGFGLANVTHRPTQLQEAELEIVESSRCEDIYQQEQFLPQLRLRYPALLQGQSIFCASFPERSACQGDSGGPIYQERNGRRFLVGVVGSGVSCRGNGVSILPGLYIDVADHVQFIDDNVFSRAKF